MKGLKNKGFTLIELLVVVLIIGILAAVALPQYQKVVVKSRVATIIPLIRSIAKAQEIYYLANGEYATNISDLDIDVPGNCTHVDFPYYDKGYGNGELVNCGDNYFLIDNERTCVRANYCPGNNTSWDPCDATKDFEIGFCTSFHKNEKLKGHGVCRVFHDSAIGNYICTTFAEYIQQD